ncbi:hypothetical protein ACIOJE_16110 [Kitasatospora sp. NPDC087861]|uniref:hypothetical protein n=1 Tax=Kitasatospora sp. NPDC087861 TaxID=3364070 RepID=UPI00381B97C9
MIAMTATAQPEPPRPEPLQPEVPEELLTCFVIGPIGDRHAEVGSPARQAYETSLETFEEVIGPACAAFRVQAVRADQIQQAGEITEQICRHVLQSDIVIADVTGGNANVMYELGLRHTTGRLTIHIGEHGRLPFDISPIRTILFKRSRSGLVNARNELQEALERGIREGFAPLTPARILLGLRSPDGVEVSPDGTEVEVSAKPRPDEADAPGLIDLFATVEAEMDLMTEGIETMTGLVNTIGTLAEEFGPDMKRASANGAPPSAALATARRFGAALSRPAAELKTCAAEFTTRMSNIDATVHASLDMFQHLPQTGDGQETHGFLHQLIDMSQASREGLETLRLFRMMMEWLTNVSRDLWAPARDIMAALDLVTDAMVRVESWDQRARALV